MSIRCWWKRQCWRWRQGGVRLRLGRVELRVGTRKQRDAKLSAWVNPSGTRMQRAIHKLRDEEPSLVSVARDEGVTTKHYSDGTQEEVSELSPELQAGFDLLDPRVPVRTPWGLRYECPAPADSPYPNAIHLSSSPPEEEASP